MNKYYPGDDVRLLATFRQLNLSLIDPASVVFYVLPPTGGVQTPSVIHDSTGMFHADVLVPVGAASVGTWNYRVESTGTPTRALEGSFYVQQTSFAA